MTSVKMGLLSLICYTLFLSYLSGRGRRCTILRLWSRCTILRLLWSGGLLNNDLLRRLLLNHNYWLITLGCE